MDYVCIYSIFYAKECGNQMKEIVNISNIVEYENPNYIFLKVTPSTSLRNYNSDIFFSIISKLNLDINDRIQFVNNKLHIRNSPKLGYYIYIEKSQVQFYFIVPEKHYNLFKDKIIDTWSNKITVTKIQDIPNFDQDCTKYYLTYKRADAMSLTCDKRNNDLLASQLNVLHIMESGDKVGVFYNFLPMNQDYWKANWDNAIKDMQHNIPTSHCKINGWYVLKLAINLLVKLTDVVLDSISFSKTNSNKTILLKDLELSKATKDKREKDIIKSQIVVFSESENKDREKNNVISLCNSFQCLDADNKLVYKNISKKKVNLLDTIIKGADTFKIQPKEGQNFISLPAKELLTEFKIIEHISVLEQEIPDCLLNGIIRLGTSTYKDNNTIPVYLPTSKNERCLTLVLIGANRTGKSTYLANIANDSLNGGECTIFFDFCGNCETSDSINHVVKSKIKNIDCSDLNNLQGMGYNEVREDKTNVLKQYENAKIKTSQLLTLIDSVNAEDRDLKAKMNKYLSAAALIVFISNGSIKDVIGVLEDHVLRMNYIKMIPEELHKYLYGYITLLKELNEIKNDKVVGSKSNTAISGIMDRIEQLKTNTYMELMLMKDCKNNFDLIDEIQKNQIICFRMPEVMFSTQSEKDAYCTYWMTKIWLALKYRNTYIPVDKQVKVNIIVDELYQVEKCQDFIRSKLSQMAKFNCKMIISCHYLNQISIIREELRSANASYMLISGCNKKNYKELEEELQPYTLDDLLNLKRFHSLNLIKLPDGYVSFVTQLPRPLK